MCYILLTVYITLYITLYYYITDGASVEAVIFIPYDDMWGGGSLTNL